MSMKPLMSKWQVHVMLACGSAIGLGVIALGQSGPDEHAMLNRDAVQAQRGADVHAAALPNLPGGFALGPGDVIAVAVWKDVELSRTMPVRPDGKISLPILGELQASGLTTFELQQVIAEKLRPYVRNPEVNVIVEEIKSRTFNVVGRIMKPGSYALIKPTTVLDAIAVGGGFQDYACVSKIYVLRHSPGSSETMLRFNYKQVIRGKRAEQNIQLMPGDTVVVP